MLFSSFRVFSIYHPLTLKSMGHPYATIRFQMAPSSTHWPWQDYIIQRWRWKSPLIHQNNILCSNLFVDLIPLMILSLWSAFSLGHHGCQRHVCWMLQLCCLLAGFFNLVSNDGSMLSVSICERAPRASEMSAATTKEKGHRNRYKRVSLKGTFATHFQKAQNRQDSFYLIASMCFTGSTS